MVMELPMLARLRGEPVAVDALVEVAR